MANTNSEIYDTNVPVHRTTTTMESSSLPTPKSTRLDITAISMKHWTADQKQEFVETLVDRCNNAGSTVSKNGDKPTITSVLISGQRLLKVLTKVQIITLMKSISKLQTVTEYNCFHGKCHVLTTDLLAMSLPPNVQTVLLWNFRMFSHNFIMKLRQQITISKLVLNFPFERRNQMTWGCFDVGCMALCSMEHLHTLHIRCVLPEGARYIRQNECILSPEAMVVLLNSTSIRHLYLENCGLLDDHMDEVCNELPNNKSLVSLHMKDNLFSDDCLYTIGRLLPMAPAQFQSLDVTGVSISAAGGTAAAAGMLQNTTLLSLKLESVWSACDIFDIDNDDDDDDDEENVVKKDHSTEVWMRQIHQQLLYNKAIHDETKAVKDRMARMMILSTTSYVPPRQLVVDAQHAMHTNKSITSISDVVSIVSTNMSIVMKDVLPAKASYVVSTMSENMNIYYPQKQQQQQKQHQPPPPPPTPNTVASCEEALARVGIPPIASLSINTISTNGENKNRGSVFSCSFD